MVGQVSITLPVLVAKFNCSLSVDIIMKRAEPSMSLTQELKGGVWAKTRSQKLWQHDYDCEWQTLTWLDCQSEMEHGKKFVKKLSCSVCKKYQDHIRKTTAKNGSRAPTCYIHRTFETMTKANNTSTQWHS